MKRIFTPFSDSTARYASAALSVATSADSIFGLIEMMTSHPLAEVGSNMHSYDEFLMTSSKEHSFAPTIESTVEVGKWAQKAEIAEPGAELRPTDTDAACCDPAPCCGA